MSREALAAMEVPAVRLGKNKEQIPCRAKLDTPERVEQMFPGGKWHSATFRETLTGRDNETAAAFQWINGRFYAERYGKGWALTLLSGWTFVDETDAPIPADEGGWYELSPDIQDVLAGTVAAWRDGIKFPNFGGPLMLK